MVAVSLLYYLKEICFLTYDVPSSSMFVVPPNPSQLADSSDRDGWKLRSTPNISPSLTMPGTNGCTWTITPLDRTE